jgi:hypothetical protein
MPWHDHKASKVQQANGQGSKSVSPAWADCHANSCDYDSKTQDKVDCQEYCGREVKGHFPALPSRNHPISHESSCQVNDTSQPNAG